MERGKHENEISDFFINPTDTSLLNKSRYERDRRSAVIDCKIDIGHHNLSPEDSITNIDNKGHHLEGIKELLAYRRRRLHSMDSFESSSSISSKTKRLVSKDGVVDIKYSNLSGQNSRYLRDIFHTLMDLRWRYIMLMFSFSFLISWIIFGCLWYFIVLLDSTDCVDNVDSWVSAFLFSIETQSTIGYGGRAVTEKCPEGVLLLVIQTIVGMFINSAMLGLLFAKLARPKSRGKTLMFSKKAVITVRDNNLCLMFRYVDLRQQRLFDTNIRAILVRPKLTQEGEFIPIDMADLALTVDFQQIEFTMRLFPLYPLTIMHVIDENSPLYTISKSQLEQAEFEIIPILEGTVPTTGNCTQALTSFKPTEILWGHRFKPIFTGIHIGQNINKIDLSTLHDTYKENHTPDCSAEVYEKIKGKNDDDFSSTTSESNGYESGAPSSFSLNCQSRENSEQLDNEVCININTDSIHKMSSLRETKA